jgi:diguanylate cyclase (GGDEF)-like protein
MVLNGTNRHRELGLKVEEAFASRSWVGALSQPLCWTLAILTTHLADRAPVLMWTAFATLSAFTALRLILLARMHHIYASNPHRWQILHTATILGSFAIWGLVPGWSIRTYGYHNEDTLVLLFYHAAISFAMVNTLIHDFRLMKVGAGMLFAPVLIAQLFFGGPARWAPFAAFVFYLVFLLSQGKRLTLAYRQQIHDNHDLAVLAHSDHLTGLPNRRSMNEALERSLREAREQDTHVAVLYIDLDGFKRINDNLSHRVGDLFLSEVAARLTERMRGAGFVARLGGDEFAALVMDASPEIAAGIAAEILDITREPVFIENHRLESSASIGISLFPEDADDADHLMRAADHAMYDAKASGKDRVCFFRSSASLALELNNLPASKLVR